MIENKKTNNPITIHYTLLTHKRPCMVETTVQSLSAIYLCSKCI